MLIPWRVVEFVTLFIFSLVFASSLWIFTDSTIASQDSFDLGKGQMIDMIVRIVIFKLLQFWTDISVWHDFGIGIYTVYRISIEFL